MFGNPEGSSHQKVVLPSVTQSNLLDTEHSANTPEKLLIALLQLIFTSEELALKSDIKQFDMERLWAMRYKFIFQHTGYVYYNNYLLADYIDYIYPLEEVDSMEKRWTTLPQKTINLKCRQLRHKEKQ